MAGGGRKKGAHVVLIDETGLLLNPLVRRTWAPVGRTPVVGGWGRHRRRVSAIGAVTVSPHARRVGFQFATEEDGYFTAAKVVAFLRRLVARLRGPVVVVWDGGRNHQGEEVKAFLRRHRRVRLVRLPAYSPHLNPVEAVWSWLKYSRLANAVPADVTELHRWVTAHLTELATRPDLIRRLWEASELPFPPRRRTQPRQPAGQ